MDQIRHMRRRSSRSSEQPRRYDGVLLPARPGDDVPQIPLDITDLNDEELMNLFARYSAWASFIAVRVAQAEIAEANATTELKVSEAQAMVDNWTGAKDDRVTITRAERDLDPTVRAQQDRYDTARAHRKMLATLADNMERASALVSRELTRRLGRDQVDRRIARWTP